MRCRAMPAGGLRSFSDGTGWRCRRAFDRSHRAIRAPRTRRCGAVSRSRSRGCAGRCRTGPRRGGGDHRLTEVEALGGRVVAAVGDGTRRRAGAGSRLREELGAGHVRPPVRDSLLRSLRRRCTGSGERARTSIRLRISSTSAEPRLPSDEVDEQSLAADDPVRQLLSVVDAPHRGLEPVPCRRERNCPLEIESQRGRGRG